MMRINERQQKTPWEEITDVEGEPDFNLQYATLEYCST